MFPLPFNVLKQKPILVPVNELEDASQHMSPALLNPKVQHELSLVEHLVLVGKDADVPFTPYFQKCQRKKINKEAAI